MMKPYPRRFASGDEVIFNYRLCRARRVIENAFGIMTARFRVLLNFIETRLQTTASITRACLVLHNHLMNKQCYNPPGFCDAEDENGNLTPGAWRLEVTDSDANVGRSNNASSLYARMIRDILKDY